MRRDSYPVFTLHDLQLRRRSIAADLRDRSKRGCQESLHLVRKDPLWQNAVVTVIEEMEYLCPILGMFCVL